MKLEGFGGSLTQTFTQVSTTQPYKLQTSSIFIFYCLNYLSFSTYHSNRVISWWLIGYQAHLKYKRLEVGVELLYVLYLPYTNVYTSTHRRLYQCIYQYKKYLYLYISVHGCNTDTHSPLICNPKFTSSEPMGTMESWCIRPQGNHQILHREVLVRCLLGRLTKAFRNGTVRPG